MTSAVMFYWVNSVKADTAHTAIGEVIC